MHQPSESAPSPGTPSGQRGLRSALRQGAIDSGVSRLGMRWRFRAVVMTLALPFLGYIVWAATEQAAIEKAHASEQAREQAVLIAARLDDYIANVDSLLETTAASAAVAFGDPDSLSAMIRGMAPRLPKGIHNVTAWSLDGRNVGSLDPRSGLKGIDISDRAYFREALDRLDLAIEGPIVARATGVGILSLARPIMGRDGKALGVLSAACRLDELTAAIDPRGFVAEHALITVVDRGGAIVARSVDGAYWFRKPGVDAERAAQRFARQTGAEEETGVDGRVRLSGFAVASKVPWMVVVGEPIETAIAPVSQRLLKGLVIGLVIFAIAMVIAGRIASWTVEPVLRLAADADLLGAGNLAHRSTVGTVGGGGELATLATNFNRMAAALQERETELAASRAQLRAITDNVPQQIVYLDRDERYRFVNAHGGPFPVQDPASALGRTLREVRGDEIYASVAAALRHALEGVPTSVERTAVIAGRVVHYTVSYVPDVDADGFVRGVYGFAQDMTERKTAELLLAESERRLATITDNLPAMICYVDDRRRFRFANRAVAEWLERPADEIVGASFTSLLPADLGHQYDRYFARCMLGESCDYELQVPSRIGRRWLRCTSIPDVDAESGRVHGVYGMMHDVTATKEAEHRLTRLAEFDSLTGLANRHQFNATLQRTLAQDDAEPAPLALMFLDIDHFKQVNDRYGHATGDALLRQFAERLTGAVRATDAVARLSGDEFVVLLRGLHTDDEPQFIARKIIGAVEKPFMLDDQFVRSSTSIGIAMRARRGEPASALMKRADVALYEAKRAGRNTFRLAGS